MSVGELILYQTEDGLVEVSLCASHGTVWLTQLEMARLFDTTKKNVSLHLHNLFEEGELDALAVVKESLTTASDGKQYTTKLYNLDAILAVGYRVRSPRGKQFRKWANSVLKQYLVKGFAMNDHKLKYADDWDYFDEYLHRLWSKNAAGIHPIWIDQRRTITPKTPGNCHSKKCLKLNA